MQLWKPWLPGSISQRRGDSAGNKSVNNSALVNKGIKITSGTFVSAEGKDTIAIEKDEKEFISGGEFSSKVDNSLLASNIESSKLEDGSYVIGEKHKINVSDVTNGTVKADKETAIQGETVTLTVTANEGYKVKSVTANGVEVKDNKFVMPNKDVEVKVEFEKVTTPVVNVDTNPKTGDSILVYGIFGVIAILGLGLTLKQRRTN